MASLALVATLASAAATVYGGIQAKKAGDDQARQLERQANERRAISQREAIEKRRRAEIAVGRARAVAAASGATVDDPTVTRLIGDLEAEGEFQALSALWSGRREAQNLEEAARRAKNEGKAALIGSGFKAAATSFQGVATMRKAYKPPGGTTTIPTAKPGPSSAKLPWGGPGSSFALN